MLNHINRPLQKNKNDFVVNLKARSPETCKKAQSGLVIFTY